MSPARSSRRPRPGRRWAALIAAAAMLFAVTACGDGEEPSGGDALGVEIDDDFQAQLTGLAETDAEVAVADLVDFEWDALNIFSEGESAESIAAAAGGPVIGDEFFATAGNLWVFSADGEPVAAYVTVPDNLTGIRDPFGTGAQIVSTGGLLQLTEG